MARRMVVELTDDLDGSPAKETVTFGLDGAEMEIDLSEQHARELRVALETYVHAARKTAGGRRAGGRGRRGGGGAARGPEQIKAIRDWAKQQGMDVSERGRIPARVEEAYHAAH
jgi:Lsr2